MDLLNTKKKLTEKGHFISFRYFNKDMPDGDVIHEDCPDFIILNGTNKIGIEHTLVHIPTSKHTPEQAFEAYTDEIVAIAQYHAELRMTPPVRVSFIFNHNFKMTKAERILLGRNIASLVHGILINNPNLNEFESIIIDAWRDLPDQISYMQITKMPKNYRHHWLTTKAGWVMTKCIELFQATMDKKNNRYSDYISKCDQCWLLMAGDMKPSGFIHPNEESLQHTYRSKFTKVFYLDVSRGNLHNLNISI